MNSLLRSHHTLNKLLIKTELRYVKNISMSTTLREEALQTLKSNPYFNKYSKKIIEKQKVSPEEFYSRLEEHVKQRKSTVSHGTKDEKPKIGAGQAKSNVAVNSKSINNLEKVMKIELVKDKTSNEIKKIWEEFHKSKESTISATVPVDTYKQIQNKAEEHPVFLLPLPRDQGYEFIMLQLASNEIHFTPLISYQTHKENAPECLTIVYYPDLMEEKKIVLMKGEYDSNVINAMEAQCLANQLQLFYGENNEKRNNLMRRFTFSPDEFKHMDLIAEIECLSF